MFTLRAKTKFAFLVFSLALLRAAAQNDTNTNLDTGGGLSDDSLNSGAANIFPSEVAELTDDNNPLVSDVDTTGDGTEVGGGGTLEALLPRAGRCAEGSLQACYKDCSKKFKAGKFRTGESGAYLGCRGSCAILCGTNKGGCYKGYCWASCATGLPIVDGHEWCYTTRGYSQDYKYIKCTRDEDCDINWKCAGPCAAF